MNKKRYSFLIMSIVQEMLGGGITYDYTGQPFNKNGVTITPQISSQLIKSLSDPSLQGYLNKAYFGTNGTSYVPFTIGGYASSPDTILASAMQQDGLIVVGGSTKISSTVTRFALARFLPNGQLDSTFGSIGTVQAGTTYLSFGIAGSSYNQIYGIAIQSDGCILATGWNGLLTPRYFSLARFLPNGQLDTNFGLVGTSQAGTNYVPFSISRPGAGTINDISYTIGLQSDGKIIIAGTTNNGNVYGAVARFLSNGQLDTTFGAVGTAKAGTAYIPFYMAAAAGGITSDSIRGLVIGSDDSIYIGGNSAGAKGYFAVAKFLPNGTLDTSFGQVGTQYAGATYVPFVSTGITTGIDQGMSLAMDSGGSLFLGGYTRLTPGPFTYNFAMAKFFANGTVDTSFGQAGTMRAGTAYIPFSISGAATKFDQANALALESTGEILLGGFSRNGAANYFACAQFLSNGTLNPNFGQVSTSRAGTTYLTSSISGAAPINDVANAILFQPDGLVTLAGSSTKGAVSYFSIAQYVTNRTVAGFQDSYPAQGGFY